MTSSGAALRHGRRWWLPLLVVGVLMLVAPLAAIALTHRDPDPMFMHEWWTPIARVPIVAFQVGALGLVLLVATGLSALLLRIVGARWRVRPAVRVIAALALTTLIAVGWTVAAPQADATDSTVRALLGRGGDARPMSAEASHAMSAALGAPDLPSSRDELLSDPGLPVGPWIVQRTEILNPAGQDEYADVAMETLVDTVSGRIEAAWFYGL